MIKKKKKKKYVRSELDQDTMNSITMEEEQKEYKKNEQRTWEQNEEILRSKGIYPFISKYPQDVLIYMDVFFNSRNDVIRYQINT